jgi:hypothetical protein
MKFLGFLLSIQTSFSVRNSVKFIIPLISASIP